MPRSQEGLARLVEGEGLADRRIVQAFREVARADFVPAGAASIAYTDRPVGLPEDQTTSQPTLIARMIDAARPRATDRALEVGTGYGFQTALLARLVADVFSIERHRSLADAARRNLEAAGVTNAHVEVGDGWRGMPEHAPFDVIIVSAAASEMPQGLVAQLADGGRIVIPISGPFGDDVVLYEKRGDRLHRSKMVTPARFVPLVKDEVFHERDGPT